MGGDRRAWKGSPVLNYAVYLAVRLVVCLFQSVSTSTARTFVAGLAWLAYTLDRRHRLVALDNLRHAFPNRYSEAQLNELVLAIYRHFFTLLVEMSHMPRKLRKHNLEDYFELGPDEQTIRALMHSDRPLLMITGHFGNWEMAGYGFGLAGIKTYAVARPLDNPYLETFLRRFRQNTGQTMLGKNGDVTQIQAALEKGGKIAFLADQAAGTHGLRVNFFGRPASTHKGIAGLALQHRVPMLVGGLRKVGEPMRYRFVLADVIYPEDYPGPRPEALRLITQRYTTALERLIRTAPEQYFWLHNRWKNQPPQTAGVARAA